MPKSISARSAKAFSLFDRLQRLRVNLVANALDVGKTLWQLRENNLFKDILGDPKGTWNEFLGIPELSLPYSTANKYMRMFEVFKVNVPIDDTTLQKIPEYKLKLIYPHITEGNKERLIGAAIANSASSLAMVIAEVVSGVDVDACRHEAMDTKQYWTCKKCKERFTRDPRT